MKRLMVVLLVLMVQSAGAWQLDLTATGQSGPVPYTFTVTVGDSLVQSFLMAPPRPPQYADYAELYEPEWVSGPYLTMIYGPSSEDTLTWLLQVDPDGNIMPPIARTTTISWELANMPQEGNFNIVDYTTGSTVVANMRTTTSFEVTGTEDQYFNILGFTPTAAVPRLPTLVPKEFGLDAIQPNPFNASSLISFNLPAAGPTKLFVYDVFGRHVTQLVNGWQEIGTHQVVFQGKDLSAGIYFLRLQANGYTETRKMVLLK